jgi:hypothetical protein
VRTSGVIYSADVVCTVSYIVPIPPPVTDMGTKAANGAQFFQLSLKYEDVEKHPNGL